jgi:hypothetical protein
MLDAKCCWVPIPAICLLLGIAIATGCGHNPESRPMPAQRLSQGKDPPAWRSLVKFSDPDAGEFIVRDINDGGSDRWTLDHPELRFWVPPRPGWRFVLSFWIADATLHDTGPVTITVKVNGHLLGSIRCTQSGRYRMDEPVPIDWLHAGEAVHVLAEASPLWTSPLDGKHLGYLIQEAGFR